MRQQDLPTLLERELAFPVAGRTVLDRIGHVRIDGPPDDDEIETVGAILSSAVADETYGSITELQDAIVGNLDDRYIGRKYYDDRGRNPDGFGGNVQL